VPLLEIFLELLLWNSFQCHDHFFFFFGCLHWPEIFVPLRQSLFMETAKNHSEWNQGNRGVFHFSIRFLGQKLLDSTLWAGALSWWRIQSLGQSWGHFLHKASHNHISIST
jgi:hypothetical protein